MKAHVGQCNKQRVKSLHIAVLDNLGCGATVRRVVPLQKSKGLVN